MPRVNKVQICHNDPCNDYTTGSFYVIYSLYFACLKYLTVYVQECIYMQLQYEHLAQLWMCLHLVLVAICVIGWAYFIYDMHMCRYYIITNIFMSLFVSYTITTGS